MKHLKLLNAVLAVMCILNEFKFAESHGRLMDPPSRSTLWRYSQFRDRAGVEINYSDTSLFCGGFSYQKSKGMRCGACGDPVDGPFKNEAGGKYARHKVISRCIPIGQKTMNVLAQVTANHKGFFEYRICPNNDFKKRVSLDCLNRNLLRVAGATGTGPDPVSTLHWRN
ncbi:hypothetical protein KUTeg_004948 [Tegillarca granosa]|uniref:Chitin-binding type-4 domain-containing protein n=1 Tax=Tegillarca granosa TaxID=220873 RepID=A0ABQ9FIC5_TEGGR|nr:hypothetical protein KUTeg_004948 [Tegillarca granosa]